MTDKLIQQRFYTLKPVYRTFLNSSFSTLISREIAHIDKLSDESTIMLNNGFYLYLLLFIDLEELTNFITKECEVTKLIAQDITRALTLVLPTDFTSTHSLEFDKLNKKAATLQSDHSTLPNVPEPSTIERTFSSSQSEILHTSNN